MGADMVVEPPGRAVKCDKMFKIPNAAGPDVRIPAGGQPLVQAPAPAPFIEAVIRPAVALDPVVKKRNRSGMDDAEGGQAAQSSGVFA